MAGGVQRDAETEHVQIDKITLQPEQSHSWGKPLCGLGADRARDLTAVYNRIDLTISSADHPQRSKCAGGHGDRFKGGIARSEGLTGHLHHGRAHGKVEVPVVIHDGAIAIHAVNDLLG